MGYGELYGDTMGDILEMTALTLAIMGAGFLIIFCVLKIPQAIKCSKIEYDYVDYNHNTGKAKSCKAGDGVLYCETKDGKTIQVVEYSRPTCEK